MDFPNLSHIGELGIDYETTGLKYWDPEFRALGVGIATVDSSWYFDFRTTPNLGQWLRDMLPGKTAIAHNAQFECQVTRTLGIEPRDINWVCTMVTDCLINEHNYKYDLDSVAARWEVKSDKSRLLDQMAAAMGLPSHAAVLARLAEAPAALVGAYGAGDARICREVYTEQAIMIAEQDLERVFSLEMQLLPILAEMSWGGVRVDIEAAERAIPLLDNEERSLSDQLVILTGCADPSTFVNSPKQIREFFQPEQINRWQWRLNDGTLVGPTKSGKGPSLGQDAMRNIRHPAAAQILALRKTIKLRDTFLRGHVIGSADGSGRVHTTFNQTRTDGDAGTVTGRLSATDPALQQITNRDKKAAEILRSVFLPDEGHEWLCSDYNQIDFRCAAHLINTPRIIQAYQDNPKTDYHQIVSDMTGIPRNPAYAGAPNTKTLNLSLAFGAGAGRIAFSMGMPYEIGEWKDRMVYHAGPEAKAVFNEYHRHLPGVRVFMKRAEAVADARGYVKTAIGRRLRYPGHKAAGLLYQAYAADINKLGMIAVDGVLRGTGSRLMLSVHDEVDVSLHDRGLIPQIVEAFTTINSPGAPFRMRVPITCTTKIGPNWSNLHEL